MYQWHLRKVIPHLNAQGNLVKWVGVNTDIQEQKLKEAALRENQELRQTQHRLEAEKEFSERLLENSTDGILSLDAQGNVTVWNKTLEDLSGRRKADVLGKPVRQVSSPTRLPPPMAPRLPASPTRSSASWREPCSGPWRETR